MTVFYILQNLMITYIRRIGNLIKRYHFYSTHIRCYRSVSGNVTSSGSCDILGPSSHGAYSLSSYMKFQKMFNRFEILLVCLHKFL